MDFAADAVMDAFTPPPRAAARPAPSTDEGPSFNDHLEAVNDTPESEAPARPAQNKHAATETKPEAAPATGEYVADSAAAATAIAPPPPVVAAPVMVQLAAAAPTSAPTPQTDASAPVAPVSAPPDAGAGVAPAVAKTAQSKTARPQAPANTPAASAPVAAAANVAQPQTSTPVVQATVSVEALPPAVQQAIAATTAPVPAVNAETAQRVAKATAERGAVKATPDAAAVKTAPPVQNIATKAPGAKTNATLNVAKEGVAAAAMLDAPQTAQQQTQNTSTATATTQASTHTQQAATDHGAARAAPVVAQVAREIVRRFNGGNTNFELRLDPPELGRIDVRMEVSRDHRVTAVIAADNPQALAELARHARELEQALQSAGLELSENGLSFDLRQGAGGGETQETSTQRGGSGEEAAAEQQTITARPIGFERWRGVRVDMMV